MLSTSKKSPNVFGLMAPKQSVFPSFKLRNKHGQCFLPIGQSPRSKSLVKAPGQRPRSKPLVKDHGQSPRLKPLVKGPG